MRNVIKVGNTTVQLYGRNFLSLLDFTAQEIGYLLQLASLLKKERADGTERRRLEGKVVALIFEKDSTRTRSAFEVGALDQGAHTTYLGPEGTHIGGKESIADTAQVLGGMYDAIQFRGHEHSKVKVLAEHAGVPVYNGLTDDFHPTQILADFLTMQEHCGKPLSSQTLVYLGDGANNMANSLMIGSAKMGIDFRLACPETLAPSKELIERCNELALQSGGSISVSSDVKGLVKGADFLYTDVWLSMGQPKEEWEERLELLLPFRVDQDLMKATENSQVKFLHCLPAYHDRQTSAGEAFFQSHGKVGIEVSDEVFGSESSVVFSQSANRLHTIKALMVATLSQEVSATFVEAI